MNVPIADPTLGDCERNRVDDVLKSGDLADGEVVRSFEESFAAYCDTSYGVATSNGTTALEAALRGLGISEGDRVLTTPFSFIASANAIRLCGAVPVFADVDPRTYNLDPDAVRRTIEAYDGDVDAIVAVHLYGLPAPMTELCAIADEYDLHVVEDAAQAHGASIDGQRVGTFGDVGCFSFYPTKNMTTGEGGMVVTDDEAVATAVRRYVNHGRVASYTHETVGHNFRMTNVAAAIGLCQLDKLDAYNDARRMNATSLTATVRHCDFGRSPGVPDGYDHVYHQYTVWVDDRASLARYLDTAGISTGVYYPTTIPDQPAYEEYSGQYPNAERAAEHVLSLPVHPNLSDDQLAHICTALTAYDRIPTDEPAIETPDTTGLGVTREQNSGR
ncbi:MAG: DegT/DnrJ/EryC1/StrS family aminotransferase [Halobacteriota archaeon]